MCAVRAEAPICQCPLVACCAHALVLLGLCLQRRCDVAHVLHVSPRRDMFMSRMSTQGALAAALFHLRSAPMDAEAALRRMRHAGS